MSGNKPSLNDPDAVYKALIDLHEGLSDEESAALNARLILLLIDEVGDDAKVRRSFEAARRHAGAV